MAKSRLHNHTSEAARPVLEVIRMKDEDVARRRSYRQLTIVVGNSDRISTRLRGRRVVVCLFWLLVACVLFLVANELSRYNVYMFKLVFWAFLCGVDDLAKMMCVTMHLSSSGLPDVLRSCGVCYDARCHLPAV